MWSHQLEELGNLWRLFVLAWCHVTGCHESSGKAKEAVPCSTGFSEGCSLSIVLASLQNACSAPPLVQPTHQHHKGGLSCSLAVCMKALQRCQDEFPCARTLFYIEKVQSKYWEVKWLINWKWINWRKIILSYQAFFFPTKIHLKKIKIGCQKLNGRGKFSKWGFHCGLITSVTFGSCSCLPLRWPSLASVLIRCGSCPWLYPLFTEGKVSPLCDVLLML